MHASVCKKLPVCQVKQSFSRFVISSIHLHFSTTTGVSYRTHTHPHKSARTNLHTRTSAKRLLNNCRRSEHVLVCGCVLDRKWCMVVIKTLLCALQLWAPTMANKNQSTYFLARVRLRAFCLSSTVVRVALTEYFTTCKRQRTDKHAVNPRRPGVVK